MPGELRLVNCKTQYIILQSDRIFKLKNFVKKKLNFHGIHQNKKFNHLKVKHKKLSTRYYVYAAIFWSILTIFISLISGARLNTLKFIDVIGIDKVGHLVFYTMLSFLWSGACVRVKYEKFFVIFFCTTFGFLMEILQFYLFIGRSFEFFDALANFIGVLIGIFLYHTLNFK